MAWFTPNVYPDTVGAFGGLPAYGGHPLTAGLSKSFYPAILHPLVDTSEFAGQKFLHGSTSTIVRNTVIKKRIICLIALLALLSACMQRPRLTPEQAKTTFTRATGIAWEPGFNLVRFSNDNARFSAEGEFAVGVMLPPNRFAVLLSSPPPLGTNWTKGPVEGGIGFHCGFGFGPPPGVSGSGTPHQEYFGGANEARALLSSTGIVYCAQARGPSDMPWHNGTLLIADSVSNMVWVSQWDF